MSQHKCSKKVFSDGKKKRTTKEYFALSKKQSGNK